MNPYLITSDPGIDDLVALVLMKKLTVGQNHCLIASFGNAPVERTGVNAQEFISFAAPTWSYREGAALPLNGTLEHAWPDYFHGPDGVWGVHPKTDRRQVALVRDYPKYQHVLSLCPLTEAQKIMRRGPLEEVTIMGGAFHVAGNETEYAETNIAFDADAAVHVFCSCSQTQVKVVPLDVTRKVFWSLEKVKSIPEHSPQSVWIKTLLLAWFDRYNHAREKDFHVHDPLAVYLTFHPEKATWVTSGVAVVDTGKRRGQTILDARLPPCRIALDVPEASSVAEEIFTILFSRDSQ